MERDASSSPPGIAGPPSSPSRLLSKHRPRRRASSARPSLPQPAAPPASTRGQPDVNLCHCCRVRFPPSQPWSKRRQVRPLNSLWRVVLLCTECLSLVRSAAICSYCLSLDQPPLEDDSAIACRRCWRCVHRSCILAEHRTAIIQPVDMNDFLCVDCCPTLRSKNRGSNLLDLNLESCTRDPTSISNATRKNVGIVSVSKRGKDVLALAGIGSGWSDDRGSVDPALLDEELALQLHLEMNGSQRISRSGSIVSNGSAEQYKGKKDLVGGRKGSGEQEICVTNMMAQLDDEVDNARSKVSRHIRRSEPLVTVVLALECVKGKRVQKSIEDKRKYPPAAKLQDDLVDRYKMKYYSKRNSNKRAKFENVACVTKHDGKDTNDDREGNGAAPVK